MISHRSITNFIIPIRIYHEYFTIPNFPSSRGTNRIFKDLQIHLFHTEYTKREWRYSLKLQMLANRGSFGSMKVSNLDKRRLFEINLIVPFFCWLFSRIRYSEIIHRLHVRSHTVLFLVICRIQASSQIRGRM